MTTTDAVLAILSFVAMIIFTGIVVVFVREIDLAIVVILCLGIGMYDFWTTFHARKTANNNADADANANANANEKP